MYKYLIVFLGLVVSPFSSVLAKEECKLKLEQKARGLLEIVETEKLQHEVNGYYCGTWSDGSPAQLAVVVRTGEGEPLHYLYQVKLRGTAGNIKELDGDTELGTDKEGRLQFTFKGFGSGASIRMKLIGDELHGLAITSFGRFTVVMTRQDL